MKRIIFNADDLGRTVGINDGIFQAHRRGLVKSATLMVGFDAARDAAARLREHPRLGVGLHVTMTGARPTLPPERVPSLVDAAGNLPRKPDQLGSALFEDVMAEASNQLRLFRELTGRLPTHLDSHHHSHREPVVLEAVVSLAKAHALPVRRSSDVLAERFRVEGLASTDSFVESFFDEAATVAHLLEVIAGAAAGAASSVEVMCHPGYADPLLRAESSYSDVREREIAVLCDPLVLAAFAASGMVNSRFDEL